MVNEWIPCSKRLPEEDPTFYVAPNGSRSSKLVIATVDGMLYPRIEPRVLLARYSYTAKRWVIRSSNYGKVVAWMPLPEPYREEANT